MSSEDSLLDSKLRRRKGERTSQGHKHQEDMNSISNEDGNATSVVPKDVYRQISNILGNDAALLENEHTTETAGESIEIPEISDIRRRGSSDYSGSSTDELIKNSLEVVDAKDTRDTKYAGTRTYRERCEQYFKRCTLCRIVGWVVFLVCASLLTAIAIEVSLILAQLDQVKVSVEWFELGNMCSMTWLYNMALVMYSPLPRPLELSRIRASIKASLHTTDQVSDVDGDIVFVTIHMPSFDLGKGHSKSLLSGGKLNFQEDRLIHVLDTVSHDIYTNVSMDMTLDASGKVYILGWIPISTSQSIHSTHWWYPNSTITSSSAGGNPNGQNQTKDSNKIHTAINRLTVSQLTQTNFDMDVFLASNLFNFTSSLLFNRSELFHSSLLSSFSASIHIPSLHFDVFSDFPSLHVPEGEKQVYVASVGTKFPLCLESQYDKYMTDTSSDAESSDPVYAGDMIPPALQCDSLPCDSSGYGPNQLTVDISNDSSTDLVGDINECTCSSYSSVQDDGSSCTCGCSPTGFPSGRYLYPSSMSLYGKVNLTSAPRIEKILFALNDTSFDPYYFKLIPTEQGKQCMLNRVLSAVVSFQKAKSDSPSQGHSTHTFSSRHIVDQTKSFLMKPVSSGGANSNGVIQFVWEFDLGYYHSSLIDFSVPKMSFDIRRKSELAPPGGFRLTIQPIVFKAGKGRYKVIFLFEVLDKTEASQIIKTMSNSYNDTTGEMLPTHVYEIFNYISPTILQDIFGPVVYGFGTLSSTRDIESVFDFIMDPSDLSTPGDSNTTMFLWTHKYPGSNLAGYLPLDMEAIQVNFRYQQDGQQDIPLAFLTLSMSTSRYLGAVTQRFREQLHILTDSDTNRNAVGDVLSHVFSHLPVTLKAEFVYGQISLPYDYTIAPYQRTIVDQEQIFVYHSSGTVAKSISDSEGGSPRNVCSMTFDLSLFLRNMLPLALDVGVYHVNVSFAETLQAQCVFHNYQKLGSVTQAQYDGEYFHIAPRKRYTTVLTSECEVVVDRTGDSCQDLNTTIHSFNSTSLSMSNVIRLYPYPWSYEVDLILSDIDVLFTPPPQ